MKRMLINATHGVRVALVDGQTLYDLDIEPTIQQPTVNNIYKGVINRIENSLGAAFINYGAERDGFLPIKEIAREYFKADYQYVQGERINISEVLKPGQEVIVQVVKEQRGTKGAALRTFISLAGRYLVLMPNNPRAGGISRQIEGDEREELKTNLNQLHIPEGMGIIVRTAGVGRSLEELQWDLEILLSQWKAILEAADTRPAPFLIYQESDVITRALRDNLRPEIEEILVDTPDAYQHARKHLEDTRPEFVSKLKFYDEADPLFNRYQVESQIESAFRRVVGLPNGASIVIDPTEALTAIDINSAKATEGRDIEETALMTNIAAAKAIALQLRLRDLGGLIVIDFIDMANPKHQKQVEYHLREELKKDRARVQMGRISRFGLLEMSRQRLQPSLGDVNLVPCPRCDGQGTIRGIESLTLSILRVIEEESMKPNTAQVRTQVPIEVATFLMNEKREALIELERRHHVQILVITNQNITTPHYEVSRIRQDEASSRNIKLASYNLVKDIEAPTYKSVQSNRTEEEPAIKYAPPSSPPPSPKPLQLQKESGLIRRLWDSLFGGAPKEEVEKKFTPKPKLKDKSRSHRTKRDNRDIVDTRDKRDYVELTETREKHEEYDTVEAETQGRKQVRRDNRRPHTSGQQNRRGSGNRAQPRNRQGRGRTSRPRSHEDYATEQSSYEHPRRRSREMPSTTPASAPKISLEASTLEAQEVVIPTLDQGNASSSYFKENNRIEPEIRADHEWSEKVADVIDEPPVSETMYEPKKPKDSRRDQTGFIKLTPEQAQSTRVEDTAQESSFHEQPKLKQIV
ncbi:MAG TPA: Rne/Rng family ribonuclease, partial [Gammaproteobacteria bacterium]|nr:Rne/Rng family ribonuclease [Gammaproteobacteria bacterium]